MSRDALLLYYERELHFIRRMATGFAEKYPEVAGRLLLEPTKCDDPHVERLIEAFSMLAARIQLRLDDDFSEVTDALLGVVYPHYLHPIPSCAIVQFALDPDQGAVASGLHVPRDTMLFTQPVDDVRCRFRTSYDVRLWPLDVHEVEIAPAATVRGPLPAEARSTLRLRLRPAPGAELGALKVDRLTFFLDAAGTLLRVLYEMFARDALGIIAHRTPDGPPVFLGPTHIRPLGFEHQERLLDHPLESFAGWRLLQEYFAFADKFLFIELSGLDRATGIPDRPPTPEDEIVVDVLLPQTVDEITERPRPAQFRLGCTPAVNLFTHTADPIRLTHAAVEYPVTPDVRAPLSYEVHSIRKAWSTSAGSIEERHFQPFFGIRHGTGPRDVDAFWHLARRPSLRKGDAGTDVFLSLVDERFDPCNVADEVLHVETLCTNRDLPVRLPMGTSADFQIEGLPAVTSVRCVRRPTDTVRAPIGDLSRWRIVSHLSLNHLSIADLFLSERADAPADQPRALAALREMLRLYDFADRPETRQRIAGLTGLRSRRIVRRIGNGRDAGFARGVEVELELDQERFGGAGGPLLFASVLERFLGLQTSVNSFTQTVARVRQREGAGKRWPPRAGAVQIL